jgi:hypothetical protein
MLPRLGIPSVFVAILTAAFASGAAHAQGRSMEFAYPVKFLCGPSSESFQEGIVAGVALTAINVLNPSNEEINFDKRVSRALPYQQEGAQSAMQTGQLGPLGAMEIECNEIRQMLPSQMTEEFRSGYLLLRADRKLVVTAVYSARPRDGDISALEVQRIAAIEVGDSGTEPQRPDLAISEIRMQELRVRCPNGQGSCVATVPVTVSNIGAADAGAFRVRTSFDPGQSQQVFEALTGLAAGASQTFPATTPAGDNCFDPDCRVCAFADVDTVVAETNETNNELCEERQG